MPVEEVPRKSREVARLLETLVCNLHSASSSTFCGFKPIMCPAQIEKWGNGLNLLMGGAKSIRTNFENFHKNPWLFLVMTDLAIWVCNFTLWFCLRKAFLGSVAVPKILHFQQTLRWWWGSWSAEHTCSREPLEQYHSRYTWWMDTINITCRKC